MPREKPFRCHKCGASYTGGRCPCCYPKRGKGGRYGGARAGGGRGRGRRGGLATVWPVNPERAGEESSES